MATKILEIGLDINEYLSVAGQLKQEIDKIRKAQKELDTSTVDGAQAWAHNSASLKELNSQFGIVQKSIIDYNSKQTTLNQATEATAKIMATEATTVNELNGQITQLNKIKKNLNINNEDEKKLIDQINAKIDSNTEKVRENSSSVEKQKMNIGNYSNSIKDAFQNINPLNGGIAGFTQRASEAGGAGNLMTNSLKGMVTGMWGLVKSSLAFIATPIGAIFTAIVVVVTTLWNVFKSFQPVVDKVEQVFAALSATIKVVKDLIVGLVTGTVSLGKGLKNLTGDMKNAAIAAMELKKAQQDLDDSMEAQSIATARARAEIKALETQAKNTSLSEAERQGLLEKAEAIRQKDFARRVADANEEKRIAVELLMTKAKVSKEEIYLLEQHGDAFKNDFMKTKELSEKKATAVDEYFVKYAEADKKMSAIQEEFAAEQERNLNKQAALDEKANAQREKATQSAIEQREKQRDAAVKNATDEISLYELKNENLAGSLEYETELMNKRNAANDLSYKYGKITLLEYETEKLNILKSFNDARLEFDANKATKELELWKAQNANLLASKNEMTEAVMSAELAAQDTLYTSRKSIIEKTITDEIEKNIALQNLENEHNAAIDAINLEWSEKKKTEELARRESEQLNYEMKLEQMQLRGASELEILANQYANEQILLEQKLADKKISEEQYLIAKNNLTLKYEKDATKIKEVEEQNRIELMSAAFGNISAIFGKQSAAGKSFAVLQATFDTYAAANKALAAYPPPFSYIAAGATIATGIGNVKKILSTKEKLAKGGLLKGRSHAQGGIPMTVDGVGGYEAEGGEAVINKRSTAMYRPLLSAINVAGGGKMFADGGLMGATSTSLNTIDITNQFKEIKVINVVEETDAVLSNKLKIENRANV